MRPEVNLFLQEEPASGRTRSGKARMEKMTADERKKLASNAAKVRWSQTEISETRKATHDGEITLLNGHVSLPCAVLQDGTRVLTQIGFLSAIGRRGGAKNTFKETPDGLSKRAPFFDAENLQPFISDELRAESVPVLYRTTTGTKAWGYKADLLPKVCEVYLKANESEKGVLSNQKPIVNACSILVRGLAQVGIIALVDEATGYQRDRARDALAQILEAFIAKELQPYVKTFPADFYENLFRLRNVPYAADSVKRPQYFGVLTNDIVYGRLAPGVLHELKKEVPRNEQGKSTAKLFQKLTANVGYPKLREHLGAVVALMRISKSYHEFMGLLNEHYPRFRDQLVFNFNGYDSTVDNGQGF